MANKIKVGLGSELFNNKGDNKDVNEFFRNLKATLRQAAPKRTFKFLRIWKGSLDDLSLKFKMSDKAYA